MQRKQRSRRRLWLILPILSVAVLIGVYWLMQQRQNTTLIQYEYLGSFGSEGQEPGQFAFLYQDGRRAAGIAMDSMNNIYVADWANHRIQKFKHDGTFIKDWGGFGVEPGKLSSPISLAVDSADNLYVAESGNNRVQKFTKEGEFILSIGSVGTAEGLFDKPNGVAVSDAGDIYIADTFNNRIQQFTAGGEFIRAWGTSGYGSGQFDKVYSVDIDQQGYVYATDYGNHRVMKFSSDGKLLETWNRAQINHQVSNPLGIRVQPDGIYLVNQDQVLYLGKDGKIKGILDASNLSGEKTTLMGVAISSDGKIYVTDTQNSRILIFKRVIE